MKYRYNLGMNNNLQSSRALTILMGVVVLLFMGVTVFLLAKHKETRVPAFVDVATSTASTSAAENIPEQSGSSTEIEIPIKVESSIQEIKVLPDGTKREVRNEVPVKIWKHSNGIIVTLYEKDYFYLKDDFGNPLKQIILRLKHSDGSELELRNHSPTSIISEQTIYKVEFSPLGKYVTVAVGYYESSAFITFETSNGIELSPKDNYEDGYNWPYWNSDESKMVVLRSASPIDGGVAQIMYSPTGLFSDLKPITKSGTQYRENFIGNIKVQGNTITAETSSNEWDKGTLTVDINTGTYTAVPEIVW